MNAKVTKQSERILAKSLRIKAQINIENTNVFKILSHDPLL